MTELPPLPTADRIIWVGGQQLDHYSPDQMRAYAAEAVRVAFEDAARVCDARAKEMRGFTEEEYASEACAAAIRALAGQPGA